MNKTARTHARLAASLVLVVMVFLTTAAWTSAQPVLDGPAASAQTTQASPTAALSATPTRFPEYATNQDQTNGIVLGSTILVSIIIIGTLTVIRISERGERRKP
jgi:hypothetical protein